MRSTRNAPKKGIQLLLMVFVGILAVMLLTVAALFVIPLTERVGASPVAARPGVLTSSLRMASAILISALPSAETDSA